MARVAESHEQPEDDEQLADHGACDGEGVVALVARLRDGREEHLLALDCTSHSVGRAIQHLQQS